MKKTKKAIIAAVIFCLLVTQMPVTGAKAGERDSLTTVPTGYTAIRTPEELRDVDGNLNGKYILMNDIDLSEATSAGGTLDSGNGWKPIEGFRGILNGNGYQIKGLHQFGNAGEANDYNAGLFADISGAQIKNLGLTDCSITAQEIGFYAGVLVGNAENSTISNCYTTGVMEIKSSDNRESVSAGGIAGHSKGSKIQNSFSICNITCKNEDRLLGSGSIVGGILGDTENSGTIEKCYFAGGLTVSGIQSCQPVAGYEKNCSISNTYYLKGSTVVDGKTISGGVLTSQMNQKSSFAGFDFDSDWVIDEDAEYQYPQLIANRYYNLVSMKISQAPKEQTFECRDAFQATEGSLALTYDRGNTRSVPITEDMISGYKMDTVGTYTLAVSYRGFVDHYDIEVKYVSVKSITLSKTTVEDLEKTDTVKLSATVLPKNATEPDVTWKSGNNQVAEVSQDGMVAGVGKGSTVITVYSSDKKVQAQCSVNVTIRDHQIRYVLNGGENNVNNPSSYTVDDSIDLLPATKKGYDFTGWYADAGLKNKVSGIDVRKRTDYVLYAGWKETPYAVTYVDQEEQGYTHNNPDTITVGMGVLQLKDATRKGYDFTGWYTDKALTNKVSGLDCTKAENVSLYAGWTETPYTVTYAGQSEQGYTHENPYIVTITMGSVPLADAKRKGYTFKGWYADESLTKPVFDIDCTKAEDITVYPKWEETTYTIKYANQDEQGYTHENPHAVTIGMGMVELKNAVRKGYDFTGWYTDEALTDKVTKVDCTEAKDVMLYAGWTETEYTVTYAEQGQQGYTHDNPYTITITKGTIVLKDAQRKGYLFKGWYSDEKCENPAPVIDCTRAEDITLYPKWEEITYKVTYANQSEQGYSHDNPDKITVSMGRVALKDAMRKGYDFTGWDTDEALTEGVDKIDCTQAADVILYAGWAEKVYTVTYADQSRQGYTHDNPYKITVTKGKIALKDAQRKGYTFKNWYKDEKLTDPVFEIDCTKAQDITLYPGWEENIYSITYAGQSGQGYTHSNPDTIKVSTGKLVLTDAQRKGYDFTGWYLDKALTEKVSYIDCSKAENVTLYAGWTEKLYKVTYAGQSVQNYTHDNPYTVTVSMGAIVLKDAVRKGYTFAGWFKDEGFVDPVTEIDCTRAEDITVYPKWKETPYTVTYADQKEQGYTHDNPEIITVGMGSAALKDAVRKGYDFTGWYLDKELKYKTRNIDCTKAENVTLYAGWTETQYEVTYAGQEEQKYTHDNPTQVTVTMGKIALKDAARKGYTFKGWYADQALNHPVSEIDCTQAQDITFYPRWEETTYTVTYMNRKEQGYDHDNPETVTISMGKIALKEAKRAGYVFAGWYTDARFTNSIRELDCSKAENITLYAAWTPIKYDITYVVDSGQNSADNPDSYTVADGKVTLKDAVFRDYKFLGWYADDDYKEKITSIDTSLMKDITVYAKWEEPEYRIHLEDELGGHDPIVYRESQGKVSLTDIERAGAVFDGWYLDDQYTERVTEIDCTQCKDVTVYAKWILTKYKIEYKLDKGINDADNPSEYTVKDKEITLKAAVRGGYVFDGWYLESDCINKVEKINAEIMKNLVLYPKWNKDESDITYRIKSDSVTLNFRPSGFDYKMIVLPTRGKLQFAPHDSSYCRFSFLTSSQWNIITKGDSEEIGNLDIKDYYHVSDLSGEYAAGVYYLYMVPSVINWSSVTNKDEEINYTFYPKCTVYYSLDDKQTAIASYILQEDSEEMDITLPDIKGYTVEGLYFDTDYKEKACIDKWFGKDWVVYPKVTPVTYTVSYKLNGGENAEGNISEYTIKDSTFQLLDPVRDDYDFQGWYTDAAFRNKIDSIDPSGCKNLVLYAKWSAKEYTITYDMAGGTCTSANPAKYTINDSDFKLNEPVKTGYTFDGWYDTDGNKIVEIAAAERKSYSLMAKWKVNTYNITYNMEEGSVNDAGNPPSYTVEDENIVLKAPVRKGYVFDGWYNASGNKVGTINVSECISLVLTAKWTLARYTIRYIGDGADTMPDNPASYTVQSSTLPLQAPAKEGYTFDGWYTSDGEKLAGIDPSVCSDLVLTAKWIKKDDSSNTGKDPSGDVDDNSGKTDQNQPGDDNSGKTDQNQPGDDNSGKTDQNQPGDDNSGKADQNQPGTTDSDQKTDTGKTDTSAGAGNKSDVTAGDDQNTTDTDDDEITDDDDEEQIIVPATYICRKLVKKKSITVYMKARGVKGYQVRYSLKKNMAASKTKNSMKNKVVINKLKRKKMYYIQVRTWKTRNDQKKYSAWSRTYRIKTK